MALFGSPTKTQLIRDAESVVNTVVFLKLAINQIEYGVITEISLISVDMGEIKKRSASLNKDNWKPRIMDKLVLCFDPESLTSPQMASLFKFNNHAIRESRKKVFDSDAVSVIYEFLQRQAPPVCLLSHNGFRLEFPLLQYQIQALGRSINTIMESDLLCGDALWTFKATDLDIQNQSIVNTGTTVMDMVYYSLASLYERYVNKLMPSCLSPEEYNMRLIELVIHAGKPFLKRLCCKNFSLVTFHWRKNPKPTVLFDNGSPHSNKTETFVFFDLETTGLHNPKITEICLVAYHAEAIRSATFGCVPRIQDKLVLVVDPVAEINVYAAQLTQLSNLTISESKKTRFDTNTSLLLAQFLQRQEGPVCLVAHNGKNFDFKILRTYLTESVSETFHQVYCADSLTGIRFLQAQKRAATGDSKKLSCALKNVFVRCFPNQASHSSHEAECDVDMLVKISQVTPELMTWLDKEKEPLLKAFNVSNGGKTTITDRLLSILKDQYHVQVIHQDDYYKEAQYIARDPKTNLLMWDVPNAFNMQELIQDVKKEVNKLESLKEKSVLIVEGILLFCKSELNDLFHKRFFFTLPFEEAKIRRSKRVYEPPDDEGLFELHVWPMYLHYRDLVRRNNTQVVEVQGTLDPGRVFEIVTANLAIA